MKLLNLELVEIKPEGKKYIYIYAVLAKTFFKKKFIKFIFESQLPHYWWSEIQKAMMNNKIFFEDLTENKPMQLDIGTLFYTYFTEDDLKKYGNSVAEWKVLKEDVIKIQLKLSEEYDAQYGSPDLSALWE